MKSSSRDHAPIIGAALESAEAGRSEESAVYPDWRPITWRGASRIEYSHEELLDLLAYVRNVTGGDGHNIVKAFNGNTVTRLIAQANLAVRPATALDAPAPPKAEADHG